MNKIKSQQKTLKSIGSFIAILLYSSVIQAYTITALDEFQSLNGDSISVGNSIPINVKTAAEFIATDTENMKYYHLKTSVSGKGSISPEDSTFLNGTVSTVNLTAIPEKGWKFNKWTGSLSGSDNPQKLTFDSDVTVSASFIEDKADINSYSGSSCSFYPNPADFKLIMELRNDFSKGVIFQLINTHGDLIINEKVKGSRHELDVRSVNPGVYLIKLINANNKTITKKITIE